MSRALVFLVVAWSLASPARAETCFGPSKDGATTYAVTVTKDDSGLPERVDFAAETDDGVTAFTSFDDLTPPPPTDEMYRLVFHDGDAEPGELAVMLMEGGFTLHLTAQIWRLGADGPRTLATLNCL